MLDGETVRKIEALLASGLSIRAVSRELKVGRNQVRRIARNLRPDYEGLREEGQEHERRQRHLTDGPIERCPECGARVRMPCVLCGLRRIVHGDQGGESGGQQSRGIGIELAEEHRVRYEAIYRRKKRQAIAGAMRCKSFSKGGHNVVTSTQLPYLRWLLAHLDELAPLLELPARLAEATSLAEKWKVIKWAGDLVVAVLEDFPGGVLVVEDSSAEITVLRQEFEARGIAWEQILELLPLLIEIIDLLLGRRV